MASADISSVLRRRVRQNFGFSKSPAPIYTSETRSTETSLRSKFKQLGSLGSGNHFVEVCLDQGDGVWLVLHSGSRGVGNQLAQSHIARSKELAVYFGVKLEDMDLAYLMEGTPAFQEYIIDMLWAQDYAKANREVMLDALIRIVWKFLGRSCQVIREVNCHHNFCQRETWDGGEIWVTRKGAIQAQLGQWGIIPGSMGTQTFIVTGKGNPDSWNSCSHGAGRKHSRGSAKRTFTTEDLEREMAGKVWLDTKGTALLDEIPSAYKDINKVMADQADLVEIEFTLNQILNYKGA